MPERGPNPRPTGQTAPPLRFGPAGRFELQPAERRLLVDGRPVAVGGRALDVLITLAVNPDHLLTKNELLERAWPGVIVEESNLQVQISQLRKLLGGEVIVTVPGRGYRFVARVEGVRADPTAPEVATPSAGAALTNLPSELPELYGRADDLAVVQGLLSEHRLVSLVGAGGIGKTRVAQAVAQQLLAEFADGVWLVELAPLADPALVPSTVAQALGLQLRGRIPPLDELIASLQPRRLLLVLDNCEHLLEGMCQLVQALVTRVPQVRVLVTSQEPLRLPAEHQYRLGPLAVPGADQSATPEAALQFGAVRLFVERVRALDPRFNPDASQAAAVADICRHLDGLALAIELAAARVPSLGVLGVRDRLGERLRMLTAGSRIALRRHQTLRASLDWSHGLLPEDVRTVFRRLGVFSGGCTIEAAQRVAGDAQLDEWAVLEHLGTLVDKSLVVADGTDRPRYRLLESARAYALEKLAEADETQLLARRHAEYYAARFQQVTDALYGGTSTEDAYTTERAVELDNLRAAWAWALGDAGNVDTALTLLAQTAHLCFLLPSHDECERWRSLLSARSSGQARTPEQAALHDYIELMWSVQGLRLMPSAPGMRPLALDALRALPDARRRAYAAMVVSLHTTWRGDLAGARAALDEYDRLAAPDWPAWLAAYRLHNEIRVVYLAGQVPDLRAPLEQVLARLKAAGQGETRAALVIGTHLGEDSLLRGDLEDAAQRLGAVAELGRRQRRDAYRMCFVLGPLMLVLAELGRLDEARSAVLEALPLMQHTGMRGDYAPELALVAARRGHADIAARLLGAGDARLALTGGRHLLLERRAYERTMALLEGEHTRERIDAWKAEGAARADEVFDELPATLL
jgi:predicted ATPase/DNA-binding winged helix-turn-helix (wHTH) protein